MTTGFAAVAATARGEKPAGGALVVDRRQLQPRVDLDVIEDEAAIGRETDSAPALDDERRIEAAIYPARLQTEVR